MKVAINYIFTGILSALFLWQAWSTITKYVEEKTNLQVSNYYISEIFLLCVSSQITFHDDGQILFSSITFCKYYMFSDREGYLFNLKFDDLHREHNRKTFLERTWSRDQLFLNVSHNTVDETHKYPCNTVGRSRAGSLMGAPCSFPFRYPDCKEFSN